MAYRGRVTASATTDPRRVATASSLVWPGELASGDPVRLARSVRAAAVARRWLELPALAELAELHGADLDEVRGERVTDLAGADWLHLKEEVPSWTWPVLAGDAAVPAELRPVVDLLRHTLPVESWAAARFNFRGAGKYLERNQAALGDFTPAETSAIRRCADPLALRRPTRPRYAGYDSTLVLGAGWRSPLLRARYAALWGGTGIDLGTLYFLGSPRFLLTDPPERPKTNEYAPGAADEFDLMVAAAIREFALDPQPVRLLCGCTSTAERCPAWRYGQDAPASTPAQFTHERVLDLRDEHGRTRGVVLSASTSRPPYRPDTTDTLELWARLASPQPGSRTLAVTTPLFVPFQTFDCLKELYLVHGADVDVIGYSFDWDDRPDTPENQLQETLSALRSARRLLIAALAPFVS